MGGRGRLGLAGALALLPAVGWARPAETLRMCLDEGRDERAAAALLGRFLSTVKLEPGCESRPAPTYQGRFEARAGRVTFVVQARSGEILERPVPWIGPSATPLAHLTAADRLSEFSILVDGALAEHRWKQPEPAPAPAPPPARSRPVLDLSPIDLLPPELQPPPSPPILTAFVARPPVKPAPARDAPRRAKMDRPRPARAAVEVAAPAPVPTSPVFGAEAWLAFIHRAPGLARPQAGVTLSWRWLFARGTFESSEWQWDRRAIAFRALGTEVGGRLPFFRRGPLELGAEVSLITEQLTLRRRDTASADHTFWDLGASGGLELAVRPRPWLRAALTADAAYRPTRRDVEVPGTASIAFNTWSVRVGLGAGLLW